MKTNLTRLLKQVNSDLRNSFEKSKIIPHSGEKGRGRELAILRFLKDRIPKSYSIGTGIIMDSNDKLSNQMDGVIYHSASCPPIYDEENWSETNPSIFFIESVACLVSIKSMLNKSELEESVKNIISAKKLTKVFTSNNDVVCGDKNLPPQIPPYGVIFSYDSISPKTLMNHLRELIMKYEPNEWWYFPEVIFCLDKIYIVTPSWYGRIKSEDENENNQLLPMTMGTLESDESPIFSQFYYDIFGGIIDTPIIRLEMGNYTGNENNDTLICILDGKHNEVYDGKMETKKVNKFGI